MEYDIAMKQLSRNNTQLILHGSLIRAMLSIAVPVVISSMLQTMYNLTDTYWLGKIGTEPLAAINLVTPMQNIVLNFGSGVTVAGAVMIAQYIGAGRQEEAKKTANQIFMVAICFALVCASILALFSPAIVRWLGAQGETFRHAVSYLRIVILDMPFLFMINIYQATRQAQGDTVRPMLLNLLGISLNMAFDPLLMIAIPLGASGAALATVLAKAIPALIALRLMLDREEPVHIERTLMRPEKERIKTIVNIGLPTALGGSVMQFGFLLMSRNVFVYGVNAMAAYGIGNRVNGIISLPSTGIGSAVSTIVGQNMGAKQEKRAEQGYLLSMFCSIAFLFTGGMILSRPAISTAVVSIFSSDPEVIAMAADFLSTMAFWCWTNGIHDATSGLFKGTGHTEITMADNMARLWIYRLGTLFFCQNILKMGVRSVWYAVVVSNGISSAVLLVLYLSRVWLKPRFSVNK